MLISSTFFIKQSNEIFVFKTEINVQKWNLKEQENYRKLNVFEETENILKINWQKWVVKWAQTKEIVSVLWKNKEK